MPLDKVNNNPPTGPGVGPAETPARGGAQETSAPRGEQREETPNPARGLRGQGNDQHPRVQDVLNDGKQRLEKLLGRTGDATEGRGRGARGDEHVPPGQAKKQDGGRAEGRDRGPRERVPSSESGDQRRSHQPQRTDHSGNGRRAHGAGDDDRGRTLFRRQSNDNPGGRGNGPDGSRGRGPHDARGRGTDTRGGLDITSVVAYLRGDANVAHVPRELRQALDGASRLLGPDLLAALERRGATHDGKHAVRIIEHALARVAHTLERVAERGGAAATNVPPRVLGDAVGEVLAATLLDKYFRKAAAAGGRVVAQAEAALARLLYGEGGGRQGPGGFEPPHRPGQGFPAPHPLEILRDLQAGAFRPADVSRSPFPLSARALVATEMMELMRTLDAVERMTRELLTAARWDGAAATFVLGEGDETPLLTLLRALPGTAGGAETLDELLALLQPTLPGRAARLEIPRLVAALGGVLVNADGHAFVTKDGVPLKLDQLMWMGSLGGVLKSLAGAESFPVRLSPLLIYGFDAVYSLIGFDGRTLNPPHFAAVQAQVNGSEMEWVYGQPPLSEGWMRALIERLKDSAQADHNLLGEMLEEALADGRFHAALVGGTVSEGAAQPDTFGVTRLLPATA